MDDIRVLIDLNRDDDECFDVNFCIGQRVTSTIVMNREELERMRDKITDYLEAQPYD